MKETSWWNESQHSAGPADATQPVPPLADPQSHIARRRRKAGWWAAGVAGALVLAAGGTAVGLGLSPSGPAGGGQAAVLSAALSGTPGAASGQAGAVRARRVAGLLRHLRGIHGEFTVQQRRGGFREIAFERGVVTAVSSTQLTVRAADGTTWTWTLTSKTAVVKDRARSTASSLATGDRVFVGGPEQGAVRDARLVIVPVNRGTGQQGSRSGGGSGAPPPSS